MFRKIISETLPGTLAPPKQAISMDDSVSAIRVAEPEAQADSNLLKLIGGATGGFQLGVALMVSSGVLSPTVLNKVQKARPSTQVVKILSALEAGDLDVVQEIGLSLDFISAHPQFVESGTLIRTAIRQGHIQLVRDFLQVGYTLPYSLIVDAIRDQDLEMINRVIQERLYTLESSVILDFWYLLHSNYLPQAFKLLEKERLLKDFSVNFNLADPNELAIFLRDNEIIHRVLNIALIRKYDNLASLLLAINPTAISKPMILKALDNSCLEFLKKVWTGHFEVKNVEDIRSRKKKSVLWEALGQDLVDIDERKELARSLKLSFILEKLLGMKKLIEAEKVLEWPGAADEHGVIRVLILKGQQEMARKTIRKSTMGIGQQDLLTAFEGKHYDLCVDMLRFKEPRGALERQQVQENLIKLLEHGETCYQAIEMLNQIPNRSWSLELTKELCNTLNNFAKKKSDIVLSRSPILFCVLTAEFMARIASVSLQHRNRCKATADMYKQLGLCIEDAIKEEDVLRYYLTQKDSLGRTVLTIASKNKFFNLLENDEIGAIVSKMWVGPKRNYGILGASTIYHSCHSPIGSDDALQFTKRMDKTKPYAFHYEQWIDSCSQRFIAQLVSTLFLVIMYNLVIYTAISADAFEDVAKNQASLIYLRIAQVMIVGIMVEHILHFFFSLKTKRVYELDGFRLLDIIMFLTMVLLMTGIHNDYMGDGKKYSDVDPIMFNAALHTIMNVIIWIRLMSILLVSKRFGPFLRMIYLMIIQIITFLVLFFCLLICAAAVFTSLFNESSPVYQDFSTSLRTLYASALGEFHFETIQDHLVLGAFLLAIYLLLSNVLLLNLLIALLSSIYSEVILKVDSEHRAVVISYYDRWSWDNCYGFLIFAPSPLSYLALLLSPLVLFTSNPARVNTILCKIFYIFYTIPQYLIFLVGNLAMIPSLYIKGFLIYSRESYYREVMYDDGDASSQNIIREEDCLSENLGSLDKKKESTEINLNRTESPKSYLTYSYSITKGLLWFFIGLPWLCAALVRDSYDFFSILYQVIENGNEDTDKTNIQQIVDKKFMCDIQTVLKGIATPEVTVEQLVDSWMLFDNIHPIGDLLNPNQDPTQRKALAMDFLTQFANSTNEPIINIERMKKVLPRRPKHLYDEDYITQVQNTYVPWMLKAQKNFQQQFGAMSLGGVAIPKTLAIAGGPLDAQHIENVRLAVEELSKKYEEMTEAVESLDLYIQDRHLSTSSIYPKKQSNL